MKLAALAPAPQKTPTPTWRWIFADLLTDRTLWATPDLKIGSMARWIWPHGDPGSFDATATITSRAIADRIRYLVDGPPVAVYGERSVGDRRGLWGCWLVAVGEPKGDENGDVTVQLRGAEIHDYANRRRILSDLTFNQVDQLAIVRGLWNEMSGPAAGNIGLEVDTAVSSTKRDRTYLGTDLVTFGQRIKELCAVIGGPEVAAGCYYDVNGARHRQLRLADTLGDPNARHYFARPGKLLSWARPSDTTDRGTQFAARGAAPVADQTQQARPRMSTILLNNTLLDTGWPLLDVVADYPDVSNQATLDSYAADLRAHRSGRGGTPSFAVDLTGSVWSPANLGDTVTIKVDDAWETIDQRVRIVGCEITPATKDNPRETVVLYPEATDE